MSEGEEMISWREISNRFYTPALEMAKNRLGEWCFPAQLDAFRRAFSKPLTKDLLLDKPYTLAKEPSATSRMYRMINDAYLEHGKRPIEVELSPDFYNQLIQEIRWNGCSASGASFGGDLYFAGVKITRSGD